MELDSETRSLLEAKLERYRRLIDMALDSLTIESIRELVQEIEDQIAAQDK